VPKFKKTAKGYLLFLQNDTAIFFQRMETKYGKKIAVKAVYIKEHGEGIEDGEGQKWIFGPPTWFNLWELKEILTSLIALCDVEG